MMAQAQPLKSSGAAAARISIHPWRVMPPHALLQIYHVRFLHNRAKNHFAFMTPLIQLEPTLPYLPSSGCALQCDNS
jgi:hypothetical protein